MAKLESLGEKQKENLLKALCIDPQNLVQKYEADF